jgi:hypothetical protein
MRLNYLFLLVIAVVLGGCASSPSRLIQFATESGAVQYFFPMMDWEGNPDGIGATVDVTYRDEPGARAVCNITFSYTGKDSDGKAPSVPASIVFTGDGIAYPLLESKPLFINAEKKQTRITSFLEGRDFLALLRAQSLVLQSLIDETEYQYTPSKDFIKYRDLFLSSAILSSE